MGRFGLDSSGPR